MGEAGKSNKRHGERRTREGGGMLFFLVLESYLGGILSHDSPIKFLSAPASL